MLSRLEKTQEASELSTGEVSALQQQMTALQENSDTAMARVSALEEGLASAKQELVESEEGNDRQRAQRMEAQVSSQRMYRESILP